MFVQNTFTKLLLLVLPLILIKVSATEFVAATAAKQSQAALHEIQTCLRLAAGKQGLSPSLVFAIAEQESGFNPRAVGVDGGDLGLMQVYWPVHGKRLLAQGYAKEDMFDPCKNAMVGAGILRAFLEQHRFSWRGVGAYNAGNEAKRINYAQMIAPRVRWYEQHGTNIVAIAQNKNAQAKAVNHAASRTLAQTKSIAKITKPAKETGSLLAFEYSAAGVRP